jgi:hypothetical protein
MEGLIAAVTGPLGALALSVAILVYLAKAIVPMLKAYFDAQTAQLASLVQALEKTVAAHEADRSAFERSIERLGSRLEKVETEITGIVAKLH